jgi:hypothetical protein
MELFFPCAAFGGQPLQFQQKMLSEQEVVEEHQPATWVDGTVTIVVFSALVYQMLKQ